MKRTFTTLSFLSLFCLAQLTANAQYCGSYFTLTSNGYINNVKFSGINNSTGGTSGGPVNYTSTTAASVTAGETYTLSVTNSTGSNLSVTAFIDWNQNEVLDDDGEVYVLSTASSSTGPHTYSVDVPYTALGGATRMRVMLVYDDTPDPCISITYGEAEDYKVNVTAVCVPANELIATEIGGTSVVLNWEQYGEADEWEIKYGPSGFDPATGGTSIVTSTEPYELTGLDYATSYDFYIATTCAETGEVSDWSDTGSFTTICPLPEVIDYSNGSNCGPGSVTLTAAATSGAIINWYSDEDGTTLVHSGATFVTPELSATTTYYLSTTFTGTPCRTDLVPVTASILETPVVNLGNDTIICTGVTYLLDAGNPGASYLWNTGETTQTIMALEEGTYTVTVTNDLDCSVTDSRTFFSSADDMVSGFNFVPLLGESWGAVQFFPLDVTDIVQYYEWDFGDGSPLSSDVNPIHTFTTEGNYNVTLTVGNECFRFSISLPISMSTTGIATVGLPQADIVLYPNPARETMFIENKGNHMKMLSASVYDITGRMVATATTQNEKMTIPVQHLSNGMYSILINTDKGNVTRKFQIVK